MSKYENLASFIIENVGGKENIESVTHCVTRLRFKLKNDTVIKEEKLKNNSEIITAQFSGGRYQVVIGTHVENVYDEVAAQLGNSGSSRQEETTEGSLLNRLTSTITKIITPVLGILGACGIIAGIGAILGVLGVVQNGDGAQILFNAIGKTTLTFFPVILGYTSAKAFKLDPYVGMVLGAGLMFPNILTDINSGDPLFSVLSGTFLEMPVYKTFFGIPVMFPETGYSSTVIPIIAITWFASKVEKFFKKRLPQILQRAFVPFFTILISEIIGILVIGPITNILTILISMFVEFLFERSAVLAAVVIGLIYQPLVVLGLHWALVTVGFINFSRYNCDIIFALIYPVAFTHLAACTAVYLRTRSNEMKNITIPAMISACFNIIEPSFYGVTLTVKKRFVFCMFGSVVAGIIIAVTNAVKYISMPLGFIGIATFINPETGDTRNMIIVIIATAIAMVVTFCLTYFSYRSGEDGKPDELCGKETENTSSCRRVNICSPVRGKMKDLSSMKDQAFSQGTLGKGVCIHPVEGKVVAPCDGVITTFFPTGHAIGITCEDGAELLIHIGVNTVQLGSGYFHKVKKQGDNVKKGELLLEFDLEKIEEEGFDTDTAFIVTNMSEYLDVVSLGKKDADFLDEVMIALGSEWKKDYIGKVQVI